MNKLFVEKKKNQQVEDDTTEDVNDEESPSKKSNLKCNICLTGTYNQYLLLQK